MGILGTIIEFAMESIFPVAEYNASPGTLTDGQQGPLQIDPKGNLKVNLAASGGGANAVAFSTALEASHVVRSSAGTLLSLDARLDSTAPTATYYVQILDAAALPADGAVTHIVGDLQIAHTSGTSDQFTIDMGSGVRCANGIVVVLSSTEFTKTIAGAYLSILAARHAS